jgi:hypothetical protein
MAEQEVKPCEFANGVCIHCEATERENCEGWICPPQREWVGLTDEEVMILNRKSYDAQIGLLPLTFYRAIEAKLKEKNT